MLKIVSLIAMSVILFGLAEESHGLERKSALSAINQILEDSSFETNVDFFSYTRGIPSSTFQAAPEIDRTEAVEGASSLRWDVRAAGEWLRGGPVATVPGKRYTLSLYAKAGRDGVTARLTLVHPQWKDRANSQNMELSRRWNRYHLTFTAKQDAYWVGFVVDGITTIWLDACQVEEGEAPTPYVSHNPLNVGIYIPSQNNHVFFPGEPIDITYSVDKTQQDMDTKDFIVSFKITDFNGQVVYELREALPPRRLFAVAYSMQNPKDTVRLGLYTVRLQVDSQKGGQIGSALSTFAIVTPPVAMEEGMEPFCGICGFVFPGVKRIGAHWTHVGFLWKDLEPVEGKYDWIWVNMLRTLKQEGFNTILTVSWLPSSPAWAWDQRDVAECAKMGLAVPSTGFLPTGEHLKAWQKLFHEIAARFDKVIDIYEIGGEDDLTLGRNPYYRQKYPDAVARTFVRGPVTERLAEMVKLAAREIRDVNPQARIGAIRPSGGDCTDEKPRFTFSRAVFEKAGKEFDLFPLDPYGGCRYLGPLKNQITMPEDFLLDDFKEALALGRELGCNQRVYASEFGYAIDFNEAPDGFHSRKLVDKLVRTYLLARATAGVELCCWFTSAGCREAVRYEYGLWREYPLATVPAYSMVASVVENVREAKAFALVGDCRAVSFRKTGAADGALWLVRGEGEITISLPSTVKLFDVMGNPLAVTVNDGVATLAVGETPFYLRAKGSDAFAELNRVFESVRPHFVPVGISFATPALGMGSLKIRSLAKRGTQLSINAALGKGTLLSRNLRLAPGNTETLSFAIPADSGEMEPVLIVVKDLESAFTKEASFPLKFTSCKKLAQPVTVDGDLREWKDRPFIPFDQRGQISPPDPQIPWKGTADLSAKVYLGWDRGYFYLAAAVVDDRHFNTKGGSALWNGDSLQLGFEPTGLQDLGTVGHAASDTELGLALTRRGVEVFQWFGLPKARGDGQFAVMRDEKAKTTNYEAKIPLASLRIAPVQGTVFGFGVVLFEDDDGAGETHYFQNSPGLTGEKAPGLLQKFHLEN